MTIINDNDNNKITKIAILNNNDNKNNKVP